MNEVHGDEKRPLSLVSAYASSAGPSSVQSRCRFGLEQLEVRYRDSVTLFVQELSQLVEHLFANGTIGEIRAVQTLRQHCEFDSERKYVRTSDLSFDCSFRDSGNRHLWFSFGSALGAAGEHSLAYWAAKLESVSALLRLSSNLDSVMNIDCMLSPELSGQLVHECVGHTCEADNFSAFRSSTGVDIGDRLFNININVADDPNFGLRGGYSFDSEGVGASNVKLVKDGVLAGLLHSEETALKFRADSTGHGRTVSRGSRAMPRMSCTIVQSSQTHPNASFSVEDVAYRLRGFRGSYSFGQYCFIECDFAEQLDRGDPTGIVYRAVALLGRKLDFLNKITGLSQTSRVIEPAHGCDKEGQCGLPVSMVSPSMRIESVAVMPAQRAKRMLGTI